MRFTLRCLTGLIQQCSDAPRSVYQTHFWTTHGGHCHPPAPSLLCIAILYFSGNVAGSYETAVWGRDASGGQKISWPTTNSTTGSQSYTDSQQIYTSARSRVHCDQAHYVTAQTHNLQRSSCWLLSRELALAESTSTPAQLTRQLQCAHNVTFNSIALVHEGSGGTS